MAKKRIVAAENITTTMTANVVANTNFIADSRASKEAGRLANLLKNLNLSALITGERGVGKMTLALNIVDAPIVQGDDLNAILNALGTNPNLIIHDFHKITNFVLLKETLKTKPTRIIATASKKIDEKITDAFFGLKLSIPPLSDRPEDAEALAKKFWAEAERLFLSEPVGSEINLGTVNFDLSQNAYSLRRSIYTAFLIEQFGENDIMQTLENFLQKRIGSGDDYRKLLYLFDVPLLRAGAKKFHSQLAISKNFGLNRNTLRKKISELRQFFKNQLI